jgi:hypothetical protein
MTSNQDIFQEVPGFYRIIKLKLFRKTPGVSFDILAKGQVPKIDAIDRVVHQNGAVSPGQVGDVVRPWYMHPHQDDNLMVLYGTRLVDIYTKEQGRVESFAITPDRIEKDGNILYNGAAMLVWPRNVFHRIRSLEQGSASINLATHYEGWDARNNFSIYDLNTDTGDYQVIREGFKDQYQ